ncbi:putative nucleic acid-binding protein, contains PIN domain [Candidatus Electrothrix aarhusensis]|uniref:Putative nucleic acid-binding protein, contains PIN domain n=1 Tax=Candidatus Electrothrix aarhusensis TaxID=1859131 RepID=A0A3S3QG90_9BACT|nr:putative nucleic acid-binding protein, contains PIN domain [Candidatus Electrothrix aarhusensis]
MPEVEEIVINTGPVLALIAGLGELSILNSLYRRTIVPYEVCEEISASGSTGFGIREFNAADFLIKLNRPATIQPYLRNSLDLGESSVIQTALDKKIQTVCIDETVGRRIARLNGLTLTGSLGIMIRAKREGHPFMLRDAVDRMRTHGIWLSDRLVAFALKQAGE